MNELSVFLPVYNEARVIREVALKILGVLGTVSEKSELLIINDGSTDGTGEIARRLAGQDPRVRVIEHPNNRGYGAALRSGFYESRFEWVAFTDADGQFDFNEIRLFIEEQRTTKADIVIGFYLRRAVPWYRRLNSFLWQLLIFLFFGLRVRDIDCGFKLTSRKVIEATKPLVSERGAFISTELLVKAKKRGFKIAEVGVHHYPRRAGSATGARLNVIIKSFVDLLRLWRNLR